MLPTGSGGWTHFPLFIGVRLLGFRTSNLALPIPLNTFKPKKRKLRTDGGTEDETVEKFPFRLFEADLLTFSSEHEFSCAF